MAPPKLLVVCWALAAFLASAAAQEKIRVFGDRYYHPTAPNEFIRTYVDMPKDHDGSTVPLAIGLQMTPGYLRDADSLPLSWNYTARVPSAQFLSVPGSGVGETAFDAFVMEANESPSLSFPGVGRNPFTFAQLTFNRNGHPPIGVYDYQHFDMRFFLVEEDWWWPQYPRDGQHWVTCDQGLDEDVFWRATQPVPAECWPGDPATNANIGHFQWGQGVHIYNLLEPGWQAYGQGSGIDTVDSLTWGIQAGEVSYIEAMLARDKLLQDDLDECTDFAELVPKHFVTERVMPTRRCVTRGSANVKIEYTNFVTVSGGCADLKNSTLVGWFPQEVAQGIYMCKAPMPPN